MAYHRLGSIVPSRGKTARFAQLYVHDTANELPNRLIFFLQSERGILVQILAPLMSCFMLDEHNRLFKMFREGGRRLPV
jgi:hypothetical protein